MQILRSDFKTLSQPKADELAIFLKSDTCNTLREVAKSRIAEQLLLVGETTTANSESFMQTGAINQGANEAVFAMSRLSIFLTVLDEIQKDLLENRHLKVVEKITIDRE